jgi:hypothetical protein
MTSRQPGPARANTVYTHYYDAGSSWSRAHCNAVLQIQLHQSASDLTRESRQLDSSTVRLGTSSCCTTQPRPQGHPARVLHWLVRRRPRGADVHRRACAPATLRAGTSRRSTKPFRTSALCAQARECRTQRKRVPVSTSCSILKSNGTAVRSITNGVQCRQPTHHCTSCQ